MIKTLRIISMAYQWLPFFTLNTRRPQADKIPKTVRHVMILYRNILMHFLCRYTWVRSFVGSAPVKDKCKWFISWPDQVMKRYCYIRKYILFLFRFTVFSNHHFILLPWNWTGLVISSSSVMVLYFPIMTAFPSVEKICTA